MSPEEMVFSLAQKLKDTPKTNKDLIRAILILIDKEIQKIKKEIDNKE